MTLILTNVTPYGVVMAADDALTERYGDFVRILNGATKVFAHYGCHCALATWGAGALPYRDPPYMPVAIEFILRGFIRETSEVDRVEILLDGLVERLNGEYRRPNGPAMIDVAGCKLVEGVWLPFAFQIGNSEDPYHWEPEIRSFRLRQMRQPAAFNISTDEYPIANGIVNTGYWADAYFDGMVAAAMSSERADRVPGNTLEDRQAFLACAARAVSDLHVAMDLSKSVSTRISSVSISSANGAVHPAFHF
ncbi:MAG TPA: hypothetical protein VGN72_00790 [Tepidisphaeraceae bacterium]|jgi:hypothetical protein|nr:hypothetical protein [Tepidisphaeraceae bacterium]